jgi:hypothetical protein
MASQQPQPGERDWDEFHTALDRCTQEFHELPDDEDIQVTVTMTRQQWRELVSLLRSDGDFQAARQEILARIGCPTVQTLAYETNRC